MENQIQLLQFYNIAQQKTIHESVVRCAKAHAGRGAPSGMRVGLDQPNRLLNQLPSAVDL